MNRSFKKRSPRPSSSGTNGRAAPLSFIPTGFADATGAERRQQNESLRTSSTSAGSWSTTNSATTLPTLSSTITSSSSIPSNPRDTKASPDLAAKLNRLHQHWEEAAKLLERKKRKMEALDHKIDRIEKKIRRRQAQLFNYEFLVKDYYPQVIEDVRKIIEGNERLHSNHSKCDDDDISEEEN